MTCVDAIVLGAGVTGLTTALCLAEAGFSVRVLTAALPMHTTSAVAGAVWGPYAVSDGRVFDWSISTLRKFEKLADTADSAIRHTAVRHSGVRLVPGLEAAKRHYEPPEWAPLLPNYAKASINDLPPGYVSGWRYRVPVVDMHIYLPYLTARLRDHGVGLELLSRPVASFDELAGQARVVVNCTGLGAGTLVPDPEVEPLFGLLVVVENPGVDSFFSDYPESDEPAYYLPQGDHVVLGGVMDSHRTSSAADPERDSAIAQGIIDRCAEVEPRLASAKVISHRLGLRPKRREICLKRTRFGDVPVIHNYGHGGSGVTLSWGCAEEVVNLMTEIDLSGTRASSIVSEFQGAVTRV